MNDDTLKQIMYWIYENSDNREAMDEINRVTFKFTTKFAEWQKDELIKKEVENRRKQ
jgi:hypothetical protein